MTFPKDYVEGCFLPYTVVFHFFTYQSGGTIRIHHVVSESHCEQFDIWKKFSESTQKVREFFTGRPKT